MAIVSHFPGGGSGGGGNKPIWEIIDFDGSSQPIDDGDGNWRMKFLSSGTFTLSEDIYVDIFAVGGGGNGGKSSGRTVGGGGGGGGYTNTVHTVKLLKGTVYTVAVGTEGGTSSITDESGSIICQAAGGQTANTYVGGNGGSGGAGGASSGNGSGVPGADGASGSTSTSGTGQGSTTREFGEATGDLYAGGGGGASNDFTDNYTTGAEGGGGDGASRSVSATPGEPNTGGGGGGASYAMTTVGTGGSGIVIIRNMRVEAS